MDKSITITLDNRPIAMSDSNFSLLDLRALSEPASKLVDAISGAVGALYEPTAIRRRAKAEADAGLIAAKSEIAIDALKARAHARIESKETRRQQNIESVIGQAVSFLPDTVSKEKVDDDWIYQFFEQCQDVGNEQMKSIWAKLLAGEVAEPGSYSLLTLNVVKHLRASDAELFTRTCNYLWSSSPEKPNYFLLIGASAFQQLPNPIPEISYGALKHLEAIGLIYADTNLGLKEPLDLFYFGKGYSFRLGETKRRVIDLSSFVRVGDAMLTAVGTELFPLAGAEPDLSYRDAVIAGYSQQKEIVIQEIS